MVLPGGTSTDLTPEADTAHEMYNSKILRLLIGDEETNSVDDNYLYRARHAVIPAATAGRFQVRGKCVGKCRHNVSSLIPGPRPGRPVTPTILALCGFKLFFPANVDHHLDEVEVTLHDDGDLVVAMNDRNNDDPFGYLVDFVRIGFVDMNITAGESSGFDEFHEHARVPQQSHAEIVLRGFRLAYRQPIDFVWPNWQAGDRKLLRIGVVQIDDEIQVFFRDDHGMDPVEWTVRWALVGPKVFTF